MKAIHIFLIIILLFIQCKNNSDTCDSTVVSGITNVTGPKTGNINQELLFTVYYGWNNGCAKSSVLNESISGNTITLSVNTKYSGCACTMVASLQSTTYTFKATQAGIYFLNFVQSTNQFITDTITVN